MTGHAFLLLDDRAQEGAKKGNQGNISGTSKYGVLYTECSQRKTAMGTLSWGAKGERTPQPTLSVPGHASSSCSDPRCVLSQRFPKGTFHRGKMDLIELLDAAYDGGDPVWVSSGKKRAFIRPLQRTDDYQ